MPRYYAFEIKVDGHRYTGDWSLRQGGNLCVRSAWGGLTVEIGCEEPKSHAQLTLEKIVRSYRQAQLDELDRQAREMAKIRKRVRRKPRNEKAPRPEPRSLHHSRSMASHQIADQIHQGIRFPMHPRRPL